MTITVQRCDGEGVVVKSLRLLVAPFESIQSVKRKLRAKEGYTQVLGLQVAGGRVLEDDRTLGECRVRPGDSLQLVMRSGLGAAAGEVDEVDDLAAFMEMSFL